MAELLDRLLSRQRKRNPFSDVMGPDPLESAAVMDAAQGADVSMPAPVAGRARMADPGEGILASGGGGGGSPFRTANMGGGEAPVQAAIQSGGGKTQATQTQCTGGRCPTPRRTVISSGPQYFDDGGFPATSTVVGSPTISSSAPMMTGGGFASSPMSADPYDLRSTAEAGQQMTVTGEYAQREFAKRMYELGLGEKQVQANIRVQDSDLAMRERAAAHATRELDQQILDSKTQNAMTEAMTRDLDERTATTFLDMAQEIEADLIRTGNPNGAAVAYARLLNNGPPVVDEKGNVVSQPSQPITPEIMKQASQWAYGTAAINGLLANAIIQRDAANLGESFNSRLVPRAEGESDEAYAARAQDTLSQLETDALYRASSSVISGLKETTAWQKRDMACIDRFLETNVRFPTVAKMRALYAKEQPIDEALPPRERKAMELARDAEATRRALVFFDYVKDEARVELGGAVTTKGSTWQEMQYGEDPPAKIPAVDSNDTLPIHNPTGVSRNR